MIHDQIPIEGLKMFSDNILIYTDSTSQENIESLIESVARIQLYVTQEFNLFVRGGIVAGVLNHVPADADDFIIGPAIVDAHHIESQKAIYPRVVVSEDVLSLYGNESDTIPYVKEGWDRPFVDYLGYTMIDGFVDSDQIKIHRDALIAHICGDNGMRGCPIDRWDRIRNKDLWALSYHNDFCKAVDIPDYCIDFKEEYSSEMQKIIINIADEGMEAGDNAVRKGDDRFRL